MEDLRSRIKNLFENAEEIILKNVSISSENIGFEIRSGSGGIPPQIPIRIQYNNQTLTGIVLQNSQKIK
ncbi:MAG: hypothetical protein ACTSO9_05940 [Candidatus Helarchaeota archaeon]